MPLLSEVNKYLLGLGFVPNVKGFYYIREAVAMMVTDRSLCNMKAAVYPLIAQKYVTSPGNVEKNISNAIDRVWLKTDTELLYNEFRNTIDECKGKPTCKEFLSHAAESLSLRLDLSENVI